MEDYFWIVIILIFVVIGLSNRIRKLEEKQNPTKERKMSDKEIAEDKLKIKKSWKWMFYSIGIFLVLCLILILAVLLIS